MGTSADRVEFVEERSQHTARRGDQINQLTLVDRSAELAALDIVLSRSFISTPIFLSGLQTPDHVDGDATPLAGAR